MSLQSSFIVETEPDQAAVRFEERTDNRERSIHSVNGW